MSCPACAAVAAATVHPSTAPAEQAERAAVVALALVAASEGLCSIHTMLVVQAAQNSQKVMRILDKMADGDLSLLGEAEVVRDACLLSPKL